MATVRVQVSLEEDVAGILRRLAEEEKKPLSRFVSELILTEKKRRLDELAAEGYRVLAAENREWAELTWPIAAEGWPEWDER